MASGGTSINKGSDLIHEFCCSKCEENDLNTEAQHFCPQCEHHLCNTCVKKHRDYFKKHVVYGPGDIQMWAGFSIERCERHGEKIVVHCDDHQELCCSVCVALSHRLCSSISHLPDLAKDFLKTAEFKQLRATVDEMRNIFDVLNNVTMIDQASIKDSYTNTIADIKAFRKEINMILDQLEKKTVEQLDRVIKGSEETYKTDMETCTRMQNQLKTIMETLQQITGKHQETISYIASRHCQAKLSEAMSLVHKIQKRPKEDIKFNSDKSVIPFLKNITNLGNVDTIKFVQKMEHSDYVYKAIGSCHYPVKIKNDAYKCHIVGICVLTNEEVVIADHNNSKVKLLNGHYQVTDHFDLPSFPVDMCLTANNEVAVAVDDCAIHFLSVTRGKLKAVKQFNTDHNCNSIAHHQGELYVGSNNVLYQYTMAGQKVRTIYKDKSDIFTSNKFAVSHCGERIYATNSYTNTLVTFNRNGEVLSSLKDPELQQPSRVCVSTSGHVFVCGTGSHTVVQVDREGRKKLDTVATAADGLCKPQSVWICEQTSIIIVGNHVSDKIIIAKLS
ncbi:uncharacterized protein LOC128241115 [Mya arenaria]|uniref:uncharacterized protein LOC128241115 n=1 Tax=Mya arenaria TaxID=6604 RepID=UPI0022E1D79D|nr:uncharacterized protein LOC128241115 [Mya arenaria]